MCVCYSPLYTFLGPAISTSICTVVGTTSIRLLFNKPHHQCRTIFATYFHELFSALFSASRNTHHRQLHRRAAAKVRPACLFAIFSTLPLQCLRPAAHKHYIEVHKYACLVCLMLLTLFALVASSQQRKSKNLRRQSLPADDRAVSP